MAEVRLSPDEWTLVIPSGGNADKYVSMRFGRAWVCFSQPEYGLVAPAGAPPYSSRRVWTMGLQSGGGDLAWHVNPAPAGLFARAVRDFAIMDVGSFGST